jgi:prepilin-type N-terminal cleavage/methylation domain-containing protein
MLNKLKNRNSQEGFTIIEVLIVLAIAGLIMLVVFLAVPALQRSQRNNGRASEASRFSSAITSFVSNNQGAVPASASDAYSIVTDFGAFHYFTIDTAASHTVLGPSLKANYVVLEAGANTPKTVTADALMIDTGVLCGTSNSNPGMQTTTTGATARSVALIYTEESASGDYNQVCIQAE